MSWVVLRRRSETVIALILLGALLACCLPAAGAGLKSEKSSDNTPLGGRKSRTSPAAAGAHPGPLSSQRLSVDADYRLSPGDVVQISVFGEPTLSGAFALGPGGSIAMPLVGQIGLRGLTLAEAQRVVKAKIGTLVRHPTVTLTINEAASVRKVYVSGEVMRTGALTLPFGSTLTEAVSTAGPLPYADLRRVRLTHPGGEPIEADCSGLRGEGPLGTEHRLEYGDTIFVPRIAEEITVMGEVRAPGTLPLPLGRETTVMDALRLSQGFTPLADRSRAVLLRPGSDPITIDLGKLLGEGDMSENRPLRAGDVLVVHQAGSIAVVGQVLRPFVAPSASRVPILQALTQAGGPLPTGDLRRAQIIRDGKSIAVDLQSFLDSGEAPAELALRPGDVLVVPRGEGQNVLLVGAMARTGVVNLRGVDQRDLLRVVTLAGPTALSDLSRVTVYRGTQTLVRNLQALVDNGDLTQNLELQPGDLVVVPPRETHSVLVTGAVARRGVVQVVRSEDHDLLRIVTLAGPGALSDLSRVTVHRAAQTLVRNLKAAVEQGRLEESMPLQDGDVVVVPEVEQTVVVSGAVARPGLVRLLDDDYRDLAKLVILSTPLPDADLSKVVVSRGDQKLVVNVRDYIVNGKREATLRLEDGDAITVPRVADSVLLTGALARGGVIRLYEGVVRDLVSLVLAAGPLATADLEHVVVHRGQQRTEHNLRAMIENGDRSQTMLVEPGDIITVPPKQTISILITGAVGRPGLVQLLSTDEERRDLARLVTLAAPLPDADLTRVSVHRGGQALTRNVKAYTESADPANTLRLEDGDVVQIPRTPTVLLTGAVMRSGALRLVEGLERDLATVVLTAGPLPNADLERVTLYRGDQRMECNLRALTTGGDRSQNVAVEPGDIILVPPGEQAVLVTGAVMRAGTYQLVTDKQRDLMGLVTLAGPLPNANLAKVTIYRGSEVLVRDLKKLTDQGDMTQTLSLRDGDVVVVPRGEHVVTVVGTVARPGPLQLTDEKQRDLLRVVTIALPMAGADLTRVRVHRRGETIVKNLKRLVDEGDQSQTMLLEDGDVVQVPLFEQTVIIAGAAARTGVLRLGPGQSPDLVKTVMSVGPMPFADLRRVTVYRGGRVTTRDVHAYVYEGNATQTLQLEDGDIVIIPVDRNAVLVSGAVQRAGAVSLTEPGGRELAELVVAALPLPSADLERVTIHRGEQQIVTDLRALREPGALPPKVEVLPGDRIIVPYIKPAAVLVAGAVVRPGVMELALREHRDLAKLVLGVSPLPTADLSRVTVYRGGQTFVRNVKAYMEAGDASQTLALEDGDRVLIPEAGTRGITITGQVTRQGPLPTAIGLTPDLFNAVTLAQPLPNADLSRVAVLRSGERLERDLVKLREQGDLSQNLALEPGDVVFVPEAQETVVFMGAVARPGTLNIHALKQRDLARLLQNAGPTPEADTERVTIYRQGEAMVKNYRALERTGDMSQNIELEPGDFVYVPPDESHDVMVLGALGRTGSIRVREERDRDLLRLVTLLQPQPVADLTRVTVYRGNEEPIYRNLQLLMDEGDLSQNMKVQPGDVIVVPKLGDLYVLGAVARPGAYPTQPDWDVLDALAAAGNILPNGQQRVIIIRRRPDGTHEHLELRMDQLVSGKPPEPAKMKPGDILYVPFGRGRRRIDWGIIRDALFVFGIARDLLRD